MFNYQYLHFCFKFNLLAQKPCFKNQILRFNHFLKNFQKMNYNKQQSDFRQSSLILTFLKQNIVTILSITCYSCIHPCHWFHYNLTPRWGNVTWFPVWPLEPPQPRVALLTRFFTLVILITRPIMIVNTPKALSTTLL